MIKSMGRRRKKLREKNQIQKTAFQNGAGYLDSILWGSILNSAPWKFITENLLPNRKFLQSVNQNRKAEILFDNTKDDVWFRSFLSLIITTYQV